jgi:tetratricopeptide (TPR) repeat protein
MPRGCGTIGLITLFKILLPAGLALILLASAEISADGRRDDAAFQARLCRALLCDSDHIEEVADHAGETATPGAPQSLALHELAILNDPASPFRWCDLGQACLREKAVDRARACFRRAEELGPRNPAILMQAANFHFELDEPAEALDRTVRVLDRVTEYNSVIFSDYSRFNVPLDMVLARGIPLRKEPAQAYLHFLFAAGDVEDTRRAWQWAAAHSLIDETLAAEHVNRLWEQKQYRPAVEAWASYFAPRHTDYLHPNLIFNGDFELEPSRSILDWRTVPTAGVEVGRDSTVRYHGQYSMRIVFAGQSNLSYRNFSQTLAAGPGVYQLQARVKTSGLTTDQGIRLEITGDSHSLDVTTEALLGTTDWRLLEKTFEAPAATRLIEVAVSRKPSLKFDNKIAGTLWIDSISLVRK